MKNKITTTGALLMELAPVQTGRTGRFYPRSCGGAAYCRNVRQTSAGVLESMAAPRELIVSDAPVAFCDTRDRMTNIFTLDGRGRLVWQSSVDAGGEVTERGETLGTVSPGECSAAATGDFLVVRDSRDALHYLLWLPAEERYLFLGRLPQGLDVEVSAREGVTLGMGVEPIEFSRAQADFSGGVSEEVTRACESVVNKALSALSREAQMMGCFTSPVLVRVAARMSDGSLLALSTPRIAAPVDFCQTRHADLPLTATQEGYVGTGLTTVSARGFTLSVSVDTSALGAWEELVSEVEIWVTEAPSGLDTSRSPAVAFTGGTSPMLRVTPPLLSEAEMAERLADMLPRLLLTTPYSGRLAAEVSNRAKAEQRAVWLDDSASPWDSATAICGHGGFLHLAGLRRGLTVPVMPQGEPGATATARCRVTVGIRSGSRIRHAVAEGNIKADGGRVLPFYFYPSARAVSVTIGLDYGGGEMYEQTFAFSRPKSSENASCLSRPCREGVALERTAELTVTEASEAERGAATSISTMKRGNPLVRRCVTPAADGNIRAIRAQQSRGGAYTRQYVYLFTSKGITALTHDINGLHANCRPISRRVASGEHVTASSDEGVFALAESGELMRIADSKMKILVRGLPQFGHVAASDVHDELWLIAAEDSGADSLVISLGAASRGVAEATTADVRAQGAFDSVCGLLTVNRRLLRYVVSAMGAGAAGAEMLAGQWVSPPIEAGGGIVMGGVTISGYADAELAVRLVEPYPDAPTASQPPMSRGELLTDGHVEGAVEGDAVLPMMLPTYPDADNRVSISLSGCFEGLRGATLTLKQESS